MKPSPAPEPASAAGPVPGYSGDSWIETNRTASSSVEDVVRPVAVVHVPVEDQHALGPWAARACAAATATLLKKQKPIACDASA